MAEVKAALKDAKKAMKDNDFESVMKHCKIVLKHDRKNYNGLVIFGRACQELGKPDDSKKALMLATQVDPESPVAWQGLKKLCDEHPDIATKEELFTILSRLKDIIQDDDDKLDGIYRKLATIQLDNNESVAASVTLRELVTKLKAQRKVNEAWKSIVQILSGIKDLSPEDIPKLQEALENVLNESVLGDNEGNYQSYLHLLYRTRQMLKLVSAAKAMLAIFPTYFPLEWLCRTFVEMTANPAEGDGEYPLDREEVEKYASKLLSLNKASPWGNLAQGLLYLQDKQLPEARAHFRVGAERVTNNLLGWKLLLGANEASNNWPGVEVACKKSLDIMASNAKVAIPGNEEFESYRWRMKLTRAKAFVYMGHDNHLREAVSILEEQADEDLDSGLLLVRSLIKLKEFALAEKKLNSLKSLHKGQPQLMLLSAILLKEQGDTPGAQQVLEQFVQENPSVGEGHLELGCIYYETGNLAKAHICCMRAGKLDPSLGRAFLYLGHFFRYQDNMEKALKCYEKAMNINPCDDDTGAALSDMYRIMGKHEENIALLRKITNEVGRTSCAWAWLRLGLHHYVLHELTESILAFQYALTINPNDGAGYECLGDALLARGAYSAALKVFQHAATLRPDALYPLCQIAHIKQILGENLEAIVDYETVLTKSPMPAVEVVSLLGLAETLLASARKYYEQYFHINVKQSCLRAISLLMRAASIKPSCSSAWKLIGDACTLLYPMPPSLSQFSIPSKLMQREVDDLNATVTVDKLQILQLGARCYGLSLQITKDDSNLWHDLGINTYLQGIVMEETNKEGNEDVIKDLFLRSIKSLKKSVELEPTSAKAYNSLGVVAAHKVVGEYALAQHAFLKSIDLQPTAIAWTHLGALYLTHKDVHLAHEAFSQAQASDPSFVTCWVGQALVAESIDHSDFYDLFRHTTVLGIQVESCLGYGHHVTRIACDDSTLKNMRMTQVVEHSLPGATDSLVYYTREKETDVIALNMAGLTLEMMKLYQSAVKSYQMALNVIGQGEEPEIVKLRDGVYCNLGRALTGLGEVEEAMKYYAAIKEPDYFAHCGLALASLKAGKFEEAYNGYTSALHWLAPDDTQKSHILVALASLQYKFQNPDEAKKLLFQGSQLRGASVHGLLALAALGLISMDAVLTNAALAELTPYEHDPKYLDHIAFLRAAEATSNGNLRSAKLILSRIIHQHPASAPLWRSLAQHLLTVPKAPGQVYISKAATNCASAATKLSQVAGDTKIIAQDAVTSVIAALGTSTTKASDNDKRKTSLRQAQRAVLMCPGSAEAWAVLIAAKMASNENQIKDDVAQLAEIWSTKASSRVSSWLHAVAAGKNLDRGVPI
ncbi:superkiller complex protein 3-like [Macrobrachium nipponense]|uniref:superkiller complex protein 3-like n=1 Tax=Macrobrachium nipponense TaxID=159736 RepID=UPI0030C7C15C